MLLDGNQISMCRLLSKLKLPLGFKPQALDPSLRLILIV
jgi:hypothetical protein